MIVYADTLVFTNIIVNYFLLLLSAKLDKRQFRSFRIVLSSVFGGAASLYILFEIDSTLIDFLVKLFVSAIMVLIAFGYYDFKSFFRSSFSLLTASFVFAGVMMIVCNLYSNSAILVNNSTVYFNVSVIGLIIAAITVYLAVTVILFFTNKKALKAQICEIFVQFGNYSAKLKGFFDTGNDLVDNFSDSVVVLVDKKALISQNLRIEEDFYKKRYRVLPCKTVGGKTILEGFRADKIMLDINGNKQEFFNPLIMFSNSEIKDGYNAILNTEILNRVGQKC